MSASWFICALEPSTIVPGSGERTESSSVTATNRTLLTRECELTESCLSAMLSTKGVVIRRLPIERVSYRVVSVQEQLVTRRTRLTSSGRPADRIQPCLSYHAKGTNRTAPFQRRSDPHCPEDR